MQSLPISAGKRMAEAFKAGCQFLCRPFVSMLPDSLANRLLFLGRVCVHGPDGLRLRFHTYGPHGKDRIAVKLARRGLLGYEGETIRLFLALVKETRTVIDIGANTGLFALLAAAAEPTCRVWAFEPVPFIFDMLQKNIQLNKLENLEAVSCAVSDVVGESTFFITRTNVGIPTDSSSCQGFRDQVEEFPLPTITLDEYMSQQGIDRLELLKIDAEATESKVICGAMQTIRRDRPFIICEVLENIDHSYLQQTLPAMGYQFFHITPEHLARHAHLQGKVNVEQRNYLFVPAEKASALNGVCAKAGIAIRQESQARLSA